MTTALSTWTIDPVHSSVEFSLDYMGFSTYRTGFRALEGTLQFDAAQPGASSVTASIPMASVDVTNDRLMGRLMDPDLLGGRDHPTAMFKSTRVEAIDQAVRGPWAAVLIVAAKLGPVADVTPERGIYVFGGAVLISMLVTGHIRKLAQRAKAPPVDESRAAKDDD